MEKIGILTFPVKLIISLTYGKMRERLMDGWTVAQVPVM